MGIHQEKLTQSLSMQPTTHLFINGKFVPSSTGETFEVRNPFSGDVVGVSASASSDDCNATIKAAQEAFKTWEQTSLNERRDIFLRAADLVTSDKYRLKIVESMQQETAAAAYWALANWFPVPDLLRSYAGLLDRLRGEVYMSGSVPGAQVMVQPRAMGVIFGISPWNAPIILSIRTVSLPILCGNAVILKASENSPRSQSIVAELFQEAGLPPGVLNFLTMSKENAPILTQEIIKHPAVRSVTFVGSDRVGKIIAMEAAKNLKPCVLELGGKAPVIVLNDADLLNAARSIASSAFLHSGQVCMATTRVIVQNGVSEKLISTVKDLVKAFKTGDVVNDQSVTLGALFNEASAVNAINVLKDAQTNGAKIILGDLSNDGAVVQPHLVGNVKPGMPIWDREIFGPVLVFATAESVDEAIELANATDYSLTAALWSADVYGAQRIASRIRSGYLHINGPTVHSEASDGLVGLGGSSGYGRFSIDNFTHKRVIVTHPPGRSLPLVS